MTWLPAKFKRKNTHSRALAGAPVNLAEGPVLAMTPSYISSAFYTTMAKAGLLRPGVMVEATKDKDHYRVQLCCQRHATNCDCSNCLVEYHAVIGLTSLEQLHAATLILTGAIERQLYTGKFH